MVKKKKSVKKVSKKSHENKVLLGLGILIGLFLLFGFSLQAQNITGNAITGQPTATSPVESIKDLGKGIIIILEPLTKTLLGDVGDSNIFFYKVLFFIIIFCIFYLVLMTQDFFKTKPGISFLIIIAASIASVRGLSDIEILKTIILPYNVLGATISAGFPFFLYFLVVNKGMAKQPSIIRRTAWIFFAIVWIGLFWSNNITIYLVTAICAGIMAWMDGTISKYFLKIHGGKVQLEINKNLIRDLRLELEAVGKDFKNTGNLQNYQRDSKTIQEKISALSNI